jgi:hypothetical protein
MNTAAVQQSEVSDVSAWVALYHRASTVPSTPLVNQEVYNALVDGVADVRDSHHDHGHHHVDYYGCNKCIIVIIISAACPQ